ncbi:MAG TPA: choice-of-anchor S family protein [candidate division Zixibacteria bacterium]|nr:choice-of-anchor S family protein [candidate division Zixibacteria bacterium]
MKKQQIISLILITSFIILSTKIPSAQGLESVWGVIPEEIFDYGLNYVNITYTFGTTHYNATGITFANTSFVEQGNTIVMKINETDGTNITYELSYGPLSEINNRSSINTENELKDLFRLPLKFALEEVELDDIKRGFTGIDYPIVSNGSETWELFDNYDSALFIVLMEEVFSSNGEVDLEAITVLNYTTDECEFDWYVGGTYVKEVEEDDFVFDYNLKMAYQISTGNLLGMRMDMFIDGFHSNKSMNVILKSEVVQSGYVLGDFKLPTGEDIDLSDVISSLFPGYGWLLIPITLIPIIYYRFIKKNQKTN